MAKILIIDDEKNIRDGIKKSLEYEGYEVVTAENGDKGIDIVYKGGIDLVITDLKMPEKTGEEFLKDVLDFDKHIPVIILTGHGNIETAVDMMRLGAYDFMTKPFNLDKMLLIIARALESKNIKKTNETLEKRVDYHESFYGMIGHSSKMLKVYEAIKQVARTKATVLIEGESGTGKELVANAIHQISDRAKQPYITVNCAALSEGVLESELFGHEKGAFTGQISADMLISVGCEYVIIGHSECRDIFTEKDELINKKVKRALDKNLIPVLCVGEHLEEREKGITSDIVSGQVKKAFQGLSESEASKVVIAYEPVWAIGTGKTATPQDADDVHKTIRETLKSLYNDKIADNTIILYGGSVNEKNAGDLLNMPNIDGALVGGASLVADNLQE